MKYLKRYKYLLMIFLLSFGLFFTEFYILKGYFSNIILESHTFSKLTYISSDEPDSLLHYNYLVKYENDSTLNFHLRNNGWDCQYFTHYREGDLFPKVGEDIKFAMPYLRKITSTYKTHENQQEFECGTGLGISTFCPLESVVTSIPLKELIYNRVNPLEFFNLDSIYFRDIVNNQIVYSLKIVEDTSVIKWNKNYYCSLKDSIEFQFHLPVHSAYDKKERKIYSNLIKIPYCMLVDALENNIQSYSTDTWEFKFEYISFSEEILLPDN